MKHDKRDEGGMYRCCTPVETRMQTAHRATQTHEGRFTHKRNETERRMPVAVTVPASMPYFKDRKINRDRYALKVTK